MVSLVPFTSTRIPGLLSFNTPDVPDVSRSGVSLLATHTTVVFGISLYHIPYRFLEVPGLKKPSSKIPLDETMVSPSVSAFLLVRMSTPLEVIKIENNRDNMQRDASN
ncbi:hypothetical protein RHMOL_Rhmol04G0030000 [Rhododendron molle]|uniref:Uncharacterized protein n=1 Tax=Rhododendron molle TaxID=49168 RepID=A0ACC0NYM2_RHOML|nr:hypothetical protein RHMOL_Rhmol04G0030000 [Rhododendron molle]